MLLKVTNVVYASEEEEILGVIPHQQGRSHPLLFLSKSTNKRYASSFGSEGVIVRCEFSIAVVVGTIGSTTIVPILGTFVFVSCVVSFVLHALRITKAAHRKQVTNNVRLNILSPFFQDHQQISKLY